MIVTRHTGQLHFPSHAPEFIIPVHIITFIHLTQKQMLAHIRWLMFRPGGVGNSPWEALTTLGIAGRWACCLLQAVQQIALGASHAWSNTCICTECPFFTQKTDTFTTISKTTVLRTMYNIDLEQSSKTSKRRKMKWEKHGAATVMYCVCVTSESCSPGPHTGHTTQVPLVCKNSVWSQLGSERTSKNQTWGITQLK